MTVERAKAQILAAMRLDENKENKDYSVAKAMFKSVTLTMTGKDYNEVRDWFNGMVK